MIQTDGIRTIANPGPVPVKRKPQPRIIGVGIIVHGDNTVVLSPNRGPQANGQDWNDDACACGGLIADSPAGDKCWDCFNFDPS